MAMLDINWKPNSKELRQFAGLLVAVVIVLGGIRLYSSQSFDLASWYWRACSAGLIAGAIGLVAPTLIRPLYVAWMGLAFPIGWTISHLLLGTIYYGVVTPIGLLLRLSGNDPMKRKLDREATTYWVAHQTGKDTARYFRQY